jgi:hypothetical protein
MYNNQVNNNMYMNKPATTTRGHGGNINNRNGFNSPMGLLSNATKTSDDRFIESRKMKYSKSKQMSIFHYTLRHAKKYGKMNGMSIEWNFKHLEQKRSIDLAKNSNTLNNNNLIHQDTKNAIKKEEELAYLADRLKEEQLGSINNNNMYNSKNMVQYH